MTTAPAPLIWSVVRGESPGDRAVPPTVAGIDVPSEILAWAVEYGYDPSESDSPDFCLLVTTEDAAGSIRAEIAFTPHPASAEDVARVARTLASEES